MLPPAAALALTLALAAPAGATPQRTAVAASAAVPARPQALPGAAGIAAHAADRSTWLVGARPGAHATRLARAAGATSAGRGAWEVPVGRARRLAGRLRAAGLLAFSEPNRTSRLAQAVTGDPLSPRTDWRNQAITPSLVPPPVTPDSPLLALVDARADKTHPEFANNPNANVLDGTAGLEIGHGTATMAVAAAPQNGVGIVGAWPGMRALNVPIPATDISCSDSARGIDRAVAAGAKVVNMSYGSGQFCQTEYEALQRATRKDVVLVAAGGNELTNGNPLEFPASLPHVLTIGASTPDDTAAPFSNSNAALDLVAPGVGITTAVPTTLGAPEGDPSGYADLAGTSFSAPIVAAAATWLRQVRPDLTADQVEQVVRLSAADIGNKGYDSATGFGKLDLAAALSKAPPLATPDPQEPNDDVPYVNGKRFGSANAAIWKGGRERRTEATIDFYEDPADVYRIRIPAGQTARIVLRRTSTNGNPDLSLYSRKARTLRNTGRRLGRSRHSAGVTDVLRTTNRSSRSRVVFAVVRPAAPSRRNPYLDAKYDLRVGKG